MNVRFHEFLASSVRFGFVILFSIISIASLSAEEAPPQLAKPVFLYAKHVIIFENRVVTVEGIEAELKRLTDAGFAVRPSFENTNGNADFEEIQQQAFKWSKRFQFAGFSLGSINPRTSDWMDEIKSNQDLKPDPADRRIGRVETPEGTAAVGSEVVLLPYPTREHIYYYVKDGRTREPHEEIFTKANEKGEYEIHPSGRFMLLFQHESGFAFVYSDQLKVDGQSIGAVKLQPWGRLKGTFKTSPLGDERIDLTIRLPKRKGWPGVSIHDYETKLDAKGKLDHRFVPPGTVITQISIPSGEGSSNSYTLDKFEMKPGQINDQTKEL